MGSADDAFAQALRGEVRSRRARGDQIFLFGPEGVPFHAARRPIHPVELRILAIALRHLEDLEQQRELPFRVSHPADGYTVAAVRCRHVVYVVMLEGGATSAAVAVVPAPPLPPWALAIAARDPWVPYEVAGHGGTSLEWGA